MKKYIIPIGIFFCTVSIASAGWFDTFKELYQNENIDIAVDKAIQEGVAPDEVMKRSLGIESINPQNLVKALYCAGVSGEDIYVASDRNDISPLIISAGFKKSVEECGNLVTDTQPYTPTTRTARSFGGANRSSGSGRYSASPARF